MDSLICTNNVKMFFHHFGGFFYNKNNNWKFNYNNEVQEFSDEIITCFDIFKQYISAFLKNIYFNRIFGASHHIFYINRFFEFSGVFKRSLLKILALIKLFTVTSHKFYLPSRNSRQSAMFYMKTKIRFYIEWTN